MSRLDRRATRARIGVDLLEGRTVLSMAPVTPIPAALVRGVSYLDLQGSAAGSFKPVAGLPDTGVTDKLSGSGLVLKSGVTHISGQLRGTGFINGGHLTGTITLSDRRGSVTLALDGPTVPGFTAPKSGVYHFTAVKGTGAYAHVLGTGKIDVALVGKHFAMTFHGDPNRF